MCPYDHAKGVSRIPAMKREMHLLTQELEQAPDKWQSVKQVQLVPMKEVQQPAL